MNLNHQDISKIAKATIDLINKNTDEMSKLMTETEVSAYTGISRKTLRNQRANKTGFPYLKIGRLVRYETAEVKRALVKCKVTTGHAGT